MDDELRTERLPQAVRVAVAQITGVCENHTRMPHGVTHDEALDAIEADLTRFDPGMRRLVLAHSAHPYVDGDLPYQAAVVDLLAELGADLQLATRIAQDRAKREHPESRTARQRRLLDDQQPN